MNWYQLPIEEVVTQTQSTPSGLSAAEAEKRLQQFGPNELVEARKKSRVMIFLLQFKDLMILILLAAAIISGLIGDLTDAIVILVIVILNAIIGFIQEYRAEKAMQALKQMAVVQASVMRDGHLTTVPATALVPGDSIVLEAGNAVPADVRIVESNSLKIEEAALTGESQAVDKISDALDKENIPLGDQFNLAFKGTFVANGRGKGIVFATGMNTELGRIANMLQEDESLTPLQLRMASFGKKLSFIVLVLCIVFFVSGWLRGEELLKMTLTSISLAVAAIPEALPAVITISLALAAKRMIRLNCLVRKLPAVETLGSVSYICTDKTGTLTRNKMNVEEVLMNDTSYKPEELATLKDDENGNLLLHAFALNNDAKEGEDKKITGDSTEIALLEISKQHIDITSWPRKAEIPFDADRKLMTTFHEHEGKIISFTKGAPDVLLVHCQTNNAYQLLKQIDVMAAKGFRVMGFAFRQWEQITDHPTPEIH